MESIRIVFWIVAGGILGGLIGIAKLSLLATASTAAAHHATPSVLLSYVTIGAVVGAVIGTLLVIASKNES